MPKKKVNEEKTIEDLKGELNEKGVDTETKTESKKKAITIDEIREAYLTLEKYKQGKKNLDTKIKDNQDWYRQRQWSLIQNDNSAVKNASGWLLNAISNKHADMLDNFPEPAIRAREENDKPEAKALTSILPVILEQCNFEETYSKACYDKIVAGTAIYGVFWDGSKMNGIGDIAVECVDPLTIFWEPGITDIESSRNIFTVELRDNDLLVKQFPELNGKLGTSVVKLTEYTYDDTVDTSTKSAVINWWYKKINENGKTVVHLAIFINDEIVYSSENDDESKGFFDDSEYPFVFDVCYPCKATPCGFGYVDIGKSTQEYIDRLDQCILQNALVSSKPRYFVKNNGNVNEKEFADLSNNFIHVEGSLSEDSIMQINTNANRLPSIYLEVLNSKINELKETTGNRDVSNGGTTAGATAASAIAAMQEAGSKLSRDHNKSAFRAFSRITRKIIERIRQFYDVPRYFRILGERGAEEYLQYSNRNIKPTAAEQGFGDEEMYRMPVFDVIVSAQKASAYSKMSQNELALQFFQVGFFNPQMADQALAAMDMMDFEHKDFVMNKIQQNNMMMQQMQMMQQQMLQLASIVDQMKGTTMAQDLAQSFGGQQAMSAPMPTGSPADINNEALGDENVGESTITKNARTEAAERSAPR